MGGGVDWTRLSRCLASLDADAIDLSFSEIERIIGGPLPMSSRYQAFWSNSSSYARAWRTAGFKVTRRGRPPGVIGFVRDNVPAGTAAPATPAPRQQADSDTTDGGPQVVLIGCVKTKVSHPAPARDLYRSALFDRRRRYAEQSHLPWFILSAEHGLVHPDTVMGPYDVYLADESQQYRHAWGELVAARLVRALGSLRGLVIEVHAGAAYVDAVATPLAGSGAVVAAPLAGLRQGEQLAWYDTHDPPAPSLPLPQASPVPVAAAGQQDIVRELLAYGERQTPGPRVQPIFTPLRAANDLLLTDPFAFLLGVVFDQGITAERAWEAPYQLQQRLGHFDLARIAAQPDAVHAAIGLPPVLHRYREKMPAWVTAAARKVLTDYHGDATAIWSDQPTAATLQRRLVDFDGIGQKKAAMTVEILARTMGVQVRDLSGSDIAYDVHVRRVMLRSGLAQRDDPDRMVAVARALYPPRPGALDDPAWRIGRQWCHAGTPDCHFCVLTHVCPKQIERGNTVHGA